VERDLSEGDYIVHVRLDRKMKENYMADYTSWDHRKVSRSYRQSSKPIHRVKFRGCITGEQSDDSARSFCRVELRGHEENGD